MSEFPGEVPEGGVDAVIAWILEPQGETKPTQASETATAPTTLAVFRTAAHTTHVTVRAAEDGRYSADCDGCGWTISADKMPRFSDYSHLVSLPDEERALRIAEETADKHAATCRKVPVDQWPGGAS